MKLELRECEECHQPFMATEIDRRCISCYLAADEAEEAEDENYEQQIEG